MEAEQISQILDIVQQVAILIATVAATFWAKTAEEKARLERVATIAKGVGSAMAAIAPITQTDADDRLAELAKSVESELGRRLRPKEVKTVNGVIAEMANNPLKANIADHRRTGKVLAKKALGL